MYNIGEVLRNDRLTIKYYYKDMEYMEFKIHSWTQCMTDE